MQILETSAASIAISLSRDEVVMINNALNEICNGVYIADAEFQTRLGYEKRELRALLDVLHRTLS